jgi:hypothetical protein
VEHPPETQNQLGMVIENHHQIMAEVSQPTLVHIKTGTEWCRDLQLCHNQGMHQCVFTLWVRTLLLRQSQLSRLKSS